MTYGVTSTGFVKKPLTKIIEEKQAKAQSLFGNEVDLTATSPLEIFIEVMSIEEAVLWDYMQDVYYSGFVRTASGLSLDRIADLVGITRYNPVAATGQVQFAGAAGTTVGLDVVVATVGGIQFKTTGTGQLPALGELNLPVVASLTGEAGNVAAHTITELISPVPGVNTVDNDNPLTGGLDEESDALLRLRAMTAFEVAGNATVASIKSAVEQVTGVLSVQYYENTGTGIVTVGGTGVPPKSLALWVDGGVSTSINSTIETRRPCGIQVVFYRPTYIQFNITVDITKKTDTAATTVKTEVEDAITEYFSTLKVSDDFLRDKLIWYIMDVAGVYNIDNLTVTADGSPVTEDKAMGTFEKAALNIVTVTVS